MFWIDRFHPPSQRYHTAFVAKSRAEVDAFYAAALKAGGTDNGPPGLREMPPVSPQGYYAAFVLDPDGNNIESVFRSGSLAGNRSVSNRVLAQARQTSTHPTSHIKAARR